MPRVRSRGAVAVFTALTLLVSSFSATTVAAAAEAAPEVCIDNPYGTKDLYLRGGMNGWATSADYKFTYECNRFELVFSATGSQQFKVADSGYTAGTNFGRPAGGAEPALGAAVPLADDGGNMTFAFTGTHLATIDVSQSSTAPTLRIDPYVIESVTDPVALSVQYDSRDEAFKAPYGAVTAGTEVSYNLDALSGITSAELVVSRRTSVANQENIQYLDTQRIPMTATAAADGHERWSASHTFDAISVYGYYFELTIGDREYVYGNNDNAVYQTLEKGTFGVGAIKFAPSSDAKIQRYRQTVYSADFEVPDWAADSVIYYLFPERFRNGDSSNDPAVGVDTTEGGPIELHTDWLENPFTPGSGGDSRWNNDFFGGDLAGVIEKLDYLKDLGVNTIYTTPIFEAGSNHKYDTGDYLSIDDNFGTNEQFTQLTEEAEARGMRVIIDASFNHSGADSVYFDRFSRYDSAGAFEGGAVNPESPFADFYEFDGESYSSWSGMPDLAESDAWKDFAFRNDDSITDTWLDRGSSGWRMDVAPWVSDEFWREWRTNVKENDPEALTVAETWFDSSQFFLGDTFDTTMNYIFRDTALNFAKGGNAAQVYENIELMREAYPSQVFYALMNLTSTHDETRALYEFGYTSEDSSPETIAAAKQRQRLSVLFQMTFPGAPSVYYGDEVGLTGGSDPQNRRTYPWADQGGNPDTALLEDFKELIDLRNDNDVLRHGSIDAPLYTDQNVIVLAREYEGELAITAFNNSTDAQSVTVEVPSAYQDFVMKDALTGESVVADGSAVTITVPAVFGSVLIGQEQAPLPDAEATSVHLTADADDVVVGDLVALTAAVDPSTAVGSVEFVEGETVVGTASVSGGIATADVEVATSGAHTFVARFIPADPEAFLGSESEPLTFEVRGAPVLDAEIELSTHTVVQGGSFELIGRGYAAGEQVSIELHSDLVELPTATADRSGAFRIQVTVPETVQPGDHTLVVTGVTSGLSDDASLTVTAAAAGGGDGLAVTGAMVPVALIVLLLGLMVTGGVLVNRRRRMMLVD